LTLRLFPAIWEEEEETPFQAETIVENHSFLFTGVPPGRYKPVFRAPGVGFTGLHFLEVRSGETTEVRISFELPALLRLRFTLAGKPMAGEPVEARFVFHPGPLHPAARYDDSEWAYVCVDPEPLKRTGKTDGTGRFPAPGLLPGRYTISGECGGIPWKRAGIGLQAGQVLEIETILPGGVIEGTIESAEGKPVAGAEIAARPETGTEWRFAPGWKRIGARSGSDGTFRLRGVARGSWVLRACAKGFADTKIEGLAVDPAIPPAWTKIVLEWKGLATVPIRLLLPDGSPYKGDFEELARDREGRPLSWKADPTKPGAYFIEGITAGENLLLEPIVPGRVPAPEGKGLFPEPGMNPEVRFVLFPYPRIAGRVVDGTGSPVPGASVGLLMERRLDWIFNLHDLRCSSAALLATTDEAGRFLLETERKGEFFLFAQLREEEELHKGSAGPIAPVPGKVLDAGNLVLRKVTLPRREGNHGSIRVTVRSGAEGHLLRDRDIHYRYLWGEEEDSSDYMDPIDRTDANGEFVLDGLEPATYALELRADGHLNGRKEGIAVPADGEVSIKFELEPVTESLHGRIVTDPPGDAEGMSLECWTDSDPENPLENPVVRTVDAGPGGHFAFRSLPPGRYEIYTSSRDHLPATVRVAWRVPVKKTGNESEAVPAVQVSPGDVVEIRPERGGAIIGRVVHEDGTPGGSSEVNAVPDDEKGWESIQDKWLRKITKHRSLVRCNSRGEFRIRGIPGGRYMVRVPRFGTNSRTVDVETGRSSGPVELHARRVRDSAGKRVKLRLRVFLPTGERAGGSSVWLGRLREHIQRIGTTDGLGEFTHTCAAGMRFHTFAQMPGFSSSPAVLVEAPATDTAVDLFLRRECTVSGRVTPPSGISVSSFRIGACFYGAGIDRFFHVTHLYQLRRMRENYLFHFAEVAKDGSYRLSGLPPGNYQVFPFVLPRRGESPPSGLENPNRLSRGSRRVVALGEGEGVVLDFDLATLGSIRARARGRTAVRTPSRFVYFNAWPAGAGKGIFPPDVSGMYPKKGPELEWRVVPGTYTVSQVIYRSREKIFSGYLWLVKVGIEVRPGARTDVSFDHDPARCGAVTARFVPARGGRIDAQYGLYLHKPGARVYLSLADWKEGKVEFSEAPAGTYRCLLVRQGFDVIRELRELRVAAGRVTDLGMIPVGD